MRNPSTIRLALPLLLVAAGCGGTDRGPSDGVGRTAEPLTMTNTANGMQVTLTTSGPLVQGVNDTYTWTATNVSTGPLSLVGLGSNWANADGSAPIVKALGPGCGTQGANILVQGALGVWCGEQTLAPGASITGWATVQDTAVGPVKYNFYGVVNDPAAPNFGATAIINDVESAGPGPIDLQISGSSNNGSPPVGSNYTYTYQVKNAGPWSTFGGVALTDALPASLTFVSATWTQGACTGGQTVTCALGDLKNGAQATVAITVKAPSTAQPIANTATASLTAPQADTNTANDAVTVTVASK